MEKLYLNEWLAYRGLTVAELGARSGLGEAVASFSDGSQRPTFSMTAEMAKILKCMPDYLWAPPETWERCREMYSRPGPRA